MSTSIRTAAGQQQHTYGPVDTMDMFPLLNCGESGDLGDLLNGEGPYGLNGDKALSQRFPAWGDGSLSDAVDLGYNPSSGNMSGGSLPQPLLMNYNNTHNGMIQQQQEYQPPQVSSFPFGLVPSQPICPVSTPLQPSCLSNGSKQQPLCYYPSAQQGAKIMGPNGIAYPMWWQNVNGTLMPCFAPLPMYGNGAPPSSDSDSGQVTQYLGHPPSASSARRRACVERYRKKKARRSFKKHIRYQMRKDNADKRTRVKGRFVRINATE